MAKLLPVNIAEPLTSVKVTGKAELALALSLSAASP